MADTGPRLTALNDPPPEVTRRGKAGSLVDEFLEVGANSAKVEGGSKSLSISLRRYVKNHNLPVTVLVRGEDTWLVKESKGYKPK